MATFTIVGTGTGTPQYMLPLALEIIETADVLIGGERNLAPWQGLKDKKFFYIKSPLHEVVKIIKRYYHSEKVVILVSGDPGFYSLLNYLSKHFERSEIKVIPGISSVQVAFARLSLPWHDAVLLNLHGRELNILDPFLQQDKIALLTDPVNNPQKIYEYLLAKGKKQGIIHVCTNLGYENEEIKTLKIEESLVENLYITQPTVMVIMNE